MRPNTVIKPCYHWESPSFPNCHRDRILSKHNQHPPFSDLDMGYTISTIHLDTPLLPPLCSEQEIQHCSTICDRISYKHNQHPPCSVLDTGDTIVTIHLDTQLLPSLRSEEEIKHCSTMMNQDHENLKPNSGFQQPNSEFKRDIVSSTSSNTCV